MILDPQLVAAIVGGVIGITGSLLAILVGHYIRQSGKIIINSNEFGVGYDFNDDLTRFNIEVITYNSSEVPKSLRNIMIEVREVDKFPKNILEFGKNAKTFKVYPFVWSEIEKNDVMLKIMNLPPKEINHLEIKCNARPLVGMDKKLVVYLTAEYPDGKKYRSHLFSHITGLVSKF